MSTMLTSTPQDHDTPAVATRPDAPTRQHHDGTLLNTSSSPIILPTLTQKRDGQESTKPSADPEAMAASRGLDMASLEPSIHRLTTTK